MTVMATGSPSGSVTPATDTFTNWRFGGQSTVGLAAAALQSGGRFPGMVVMVVGGRALVVVLVDVLDVVVVGSVVVVVLDVVEGIVTMGWKVASTMNQLVAAPRVRLPSCGPAALERMSSRSEAALPFCTSRT